MMKLQRKIWLVEFHNNFDDEMKMQKKTEKRIFVQKQKFNEQFNIILWPKIASLWYPTRPNDALSLIQNKIRVVTIYLNVNLHFKKNCFKILRKLAANQDINNLNNL